MLSLALSSRLYGSLLVWYQIKASRSKQGQTSLNLNAWSIRTEKPAAVIYPWVSPIIRIRIRIRITRQVTRVIDAPRSSAHHLLREALATRPLLEFPEGKRRSTGVQPLRCEEVPLVARQRVRAAHTSDLGGCSKILDCSHSSKKFCPRFKCKAFKDVPKNFQSDQTRR
jgi:hypothetical protein